MSARDDGGPAFPCERERGERLDSAPGMTLRDYFAAHAPALPLTIRDAFVKSLRGARMCGAWPYVGTPTSPGKLTEADLDTHNREMHGVDIDRVHFGPYAGPYVAPEIEGPYRLTWRERLRRFLSHAWWG